MKKSLFSKIGCTSESLATGMSREFQSCSDPAGLTLHLPACFIRVLHFGESPLASQSQVQS